MSALLLDYGMLAESLKESGGEMRRLYQVLARWDSEGGVWVAESEDVPGLVAEAESPNALASKLRVLIPELLELNGVLEGDSGAVEFVVRYEHQENVVAVLAS